MCGCYVYEGEVNGNAWYWCSLHQEGNLILENGDNLLCCVKDLRGEPTQKVYNKDLGPIDYYPCVICCEPILPGEEYEYDEIHGFCGEECIELYKNDWRLQECYNKTKFKD